jgi:DNA-binding winged helix-turn-helix (wHTH) protein/tetratricopeptide (TPR) repeat protein
VGQDVIHAFGDYELDLARIELRRSGETVPIEPQVFDVLAYLVEHRERVVTKEELLDNIWGDRFVSESALTTRIKAARRAIGDDGSRQVLIRTAHGRGYRFIGTLAGEAPSVEPPAVQRAAHLAGRRRELAELNERLARGMRGERQVVFIAGAPGIGKTTVVQQFLASLPSDVVIGVGQCVELRGAGEAYLPVLGAIREACTTANGQLLVERLSELAPSWVLQLPGLVSPDAADRLRAQSIGVTGDRMLRELLDAVCFTAPVAPLLVLALEDLHWSDGSTLGLLDALAADRRTARLLVIATHRPGDGSSASQAVHALAVSLRLRQRASLITLDALGVDEVGELVASRAGSEADAELATLIHQRTGGVPLFAEHLLDDWLRAGWLRIESDSLVATKPLAELADAIPDGIRLLIEHTADGLPATDQAVLGAAAIAGRSFTSAEVSAATLQPDEDVEAIVADLARRRMFIHADGERIWPDGTITSAFAFDHDLYRDVLYGRVGPARAAAHHMRIGSRLEDSHRSQLALLAPTLAVHYTRGGDLDQAVRYRIMAADDQLQRSAHREAIDHLYAAAELLTRLPDDPAHIEQAVHVQVALGNALLTAKGYAAPETADAYREARRLCDRLGDGAHVLPVLYGLWNAALVGGQPRAALEIAEAFLDLAERLRQPGTAVAHRAVAWPLLFLGDPAGALAHLEQIPSQFDDTTTAALIAAFGEDPAATGSSVRAWARWFCGDEDGADRAIAAAIDRAANLGHPLTEAYVHTVAALLAQMRDDPQGALDHATRAVTIASEHGIPVFEALASTPLAWASARLERDDGISLQRQALSGMARTGTAVTLTAALATLAELFASAGDPDGALATVGEALEIVQRTDERYYEPELHRIRAQLLAERGATADAAAAAAAAISAADTQGSKPFAARARQVLASLYPAH